MLRFKDFVHLPQLDAAIEKLVSEPSGLVVVAGLDPRAAHQPGQPEPSLNSGRGHIFSILLYEMLQARPSARAIFITRDKDSLRVPRQLKYRLSISLVTSPYTYPGRIAQARANHPDLLVVDELNLETADATFQAAESGQRVLTQLNTVVWGAAVLKQFSDLGWSADANGAPVWVLSVQRIATLCSVCKSPAALDGEGYQRLVGGYPQFSRLLETSKSSGEKAGDKSAPGPGIQLNLARAPGCSNCRHTGRSGEITVFDAYQGKYPGGEGVPSILPMEEYIFRLACEGYIPLDDLYTFEMDLLRKTFQLYANSAVSNQEARSALDRKVAESEAANRVLLQRTEVLLSLQNFAKAMIATGNLNELASQACLQTKELCGADRVVLYLRRVEDMGAEKAIVLATQGWELAFVQGEVDARAVFPAITAREMRGFLQYPPGIKPYASLTAPGLTLPPIQSGYNIPLFAQTKLVGVMIAQSVRKKQFSPGETALLQMIGNHVAVAIQRATLIESLQGKIRELEAAQVELIQKERIEHELDIAQDVQQSLLPHRFPEFPGYAIAAHNKPARKVGGDFYDVIDLDPDHFGVVIADVSGKGIPAALYMALTRSLIRSEARREASPCQVLTNVNQLLLELGEQSSFVSVFYGVIDKTGHHMLFSRAGHDHPIRLTGDRVTALEGTGTVLGMFAGEELNLSEEEVQLAPGDRVIFYTDGLTDVMDPNNQPFGVDRLQALLRSQENLPIDTFCEQVFERLNGYQDTAEQFDDMTLLVLEVQ